VGGGTRCCRGDHLCGGGRVEHAVAADDHGGEPELELFPQLAFIPFISSQRQEIYKGKREGEHTKLKTFACFMPRFSEIQCSLPFVQFL
jgi:hypothetical protein